MKKSNYKGHFCYKSEIGKVRINNEDAVKVLVNGNGNILLLAADGMGGHNKGDYASFETIRILSESFKDKPENLFLLLSMFLSYIYQCAA